VFRSAQPTTPLRRASSAGPTSNRRTPGVTPSGQGRTPATGGGGRSAGRSGQRRNLPARRAAPTTPHAIRALQQRRAAASTPGQDRRRSGRVAGRETPRDVLKALSRVLAKDSKPIETTPQVNETRTIPTTIPEDDLERDPDLPKPRLSLPVDEDDDDSFHLPVPRLSVGLDDDMTQGSIEIPRRAYSEQPRLVGGRSSDAFADLEQLGVDDYIQDRFDDSLPPGFEADSDVGDLASRDATLELQRIASDAGRRSSDIRPTDLQMDDDTEFAFNAPIPEPELYTSDEEGNGDPSIARMPSPKKRRTATQKVQKLSRYGIPCPSLPSGIVKKLASSFLRGSGGKRATISKDTLAAIQSASDRFFEQMSTDAATYAAHAGRKTIEESDMVTLMQRYDIPIIDTVYSCLCSFLFQTKTSECIDNAIFSCPEISTQGIITGSSDASASDTEKASPGQENEDGP
jgi:histone H3/H4